MSKKPQNVIQFSNGSEFMSWQDNNCLKCSKYENESTEESKAKCKLAFRVYLASVTNTMIPISYAKEIGCTEIKGSESVKLYDVCKQFKKGAENG